MVQDIYAPIMEQAAMSLLESETFTFVILPVLIFLARICDQTIGTMRIISVSRGHKLLAPLLGFFEVLIWIIVISKVVQNMNNILYYVAYAGGFAAGNYVGICIEEKLAIGTLVIRIITSQEACQLIETLNAAGYGVTDIPARGKTGRVSVIYTVISRSHLNKVVDIIEKFNPRAFYSIEDVRFVSQGIFPARKSFNTRNFFKLAPLWRKSK